MPGEQPLVDLADRFPPGVYLGEYQVGRSGGLTSTWGNTRGMPGAKPIFDLADRFSPGVALGKCQVETW